MSDTNIPAQVINDPNIPSREIIQKFARSAYDLQKQRISLGQRIFQQFRHKLGLKSSDKETEEKEAKKLLDQIRATHRRITDAMLLPGNRGRMSAKFKADGLITHYAEWLFVESYNDMLLREKRMFKDLGEQLVYIPIYRRFLHQIHGIGPAMAGVIICTLDPYKARHVSSFWKFAGLDVVQEDGRGRSKRTEHLVKRDYIDKKGNPAVRDSVTFNPWLKTKLFVLGSCFMRNGSPYKSVYVGYKHRLENHPKWLDKTKGHIHLASIRAMTKVFLRDLYVAWRTLEGLEVTPSYQEAKLGMPNVHTPFYVLQPDVEADPDKIKVPEQPEEPEEM